MLTYYNEAVHSLDAVGVDPIHIYDLATSKVAADNKIAGPILSLANPNARFGHTAVSRSGAPVIGRAWTSQALICLCRLQLSGRHAQVVAE
jgi:hypothetical protein